MVSISSIPKIFCRKKKKEPEVIKIKPKKLIALVDFENISMAATEQGKIVDFEELNRFLTEIGQMVFVFIFLPEHYLYSIGENLNNLGFTIVVPQKLKAGDKIEDTADISIIQTGMKFLEFPELSGLVVVSNDRHMIHLIAEAKNRQKEVFVFGTDKLSSILKQVPGINIRTVPIKDK